MHRITPRGTSSRAFHGLARATIDKADDDRLLQEVAGSVFQGDKGQSIERFQNYGFTSAILPRDREQGQQANSAADYAQANRGKSAEAVLVNMAGNRSHPVAVAIDDRRHRPRGLQGGESAQYDDQGQVVYLKRDGAYLASPKKASLRHVTKSKQGKPPAKGQSAPDYAHEGSPTAEVLCENGKVTILLGDEVFAQIVDNKVYLGGKSDDPMALVVTAAGLSKNVYARLP